MGGYDDFDERAYELEQADIAEWQREARPHETFLQYNARKEREFLEAKYPYHFVFTHEGEGGKTSINEWYRIIEFFYRHKLERGVDYQETGDGIGYSSTLWIKDPELAALFKLSYEIG